MYSIANILATEKLFGNESTTKKTERYVYDEMGVSGLNNYLQLMNDTDSSTSAETLLTELEKMDLSEEEKGFYLSTRVKMGEAATAANSLYGVEGLYQYYKFKNGADQLGNGNGSASKEEIKAYLIMSEDVSTEEKEIWFALLTN